MLLCTVPEGRGAKAMDDKQEHRVAGPDYCAEAQRGRRRDFIKRLGRVVGASAVASFLGATSIRNAAAGPGDCGYCVTRYYFCNGEICYERRQFYTHRDPQTNVCRNLCSTRYYAVSEVYCSGCP